MCAACGKKHHGGADHSLPREAEELADRIGVIDEGKLLLLEDKVSLMRRLGSGTSRCRFSSKVAACPKGLPGGALSEDGRQFSFLELPAAGPPAVEVLASLFAAQAAGGRRQHRGGQARRRHLEGAEGTRSHEPHRGSHAARKGGAPVLRSGGQTILQPLVSTSLYFVVFGYTLGGGRRASEGVPYIEYIVPGLVFLGVANNAFLNASSSFFIGRIQGHHRRLLVAPLGPLELLFGFITGAMARGPFGGAPHLAVAWPSRTSTWPASSRRLLAIRPTSSRCGLLAGNVGRESFEQ